MTTTTRRTRPVTTSSESKNQPIRVACYLRISTDEDHQPFSLGAQETRLRSFVASQPGWQHVKTYIDQFSGAYSERPAITEGLRDARLGRYDILLVHRVDRFARSLKVLVGLLDQLEQAGVGFRSATEPIDTSTPTGRMLVQLLGVFAEFERATIIDRVVSGMERKAAGGEWPAGALPYGLCLDQEHHLASEPTEFPLVERMFIRYGVEGVGTTRIAAELNEDGHRTRRGRRFSGKAVLDILRNRSYLGEISFRGVRHQSEKALIDPALFDEVQVILALRRKSDTRRLPDTYSDYLLTGLITCERCHRNYVGAATSGKSRRYRYYVCCTRQRLGKVACDGPRIRADRLEEAVFAALVSIYADPELIERAIAAEARDLAGTVRRRRDAIANTERDLEKTEAAIERYMHAFEVGSIAEDVFGPRVRELHSEGQSLRRRRDELLKVTQVAAVAPPTQAQIDALRPELEDEVARESIGRRKSIVRAFVGLIVVKKDDTIQAGFYVRGSLPPDVDEGHGTASSRRSPRAITSTVDAPTRPSDAVTKHSQICVSEFRNSEFAAPAVSAFRT